MKKKKPKIFMADFETTTTTILKDTGEKEKAKAVWEAVNRRVPTTAKEGDYPPVIYTSIEDFFQGLYNEKTSCVVFFHNLQYDGNFILSYLNDIGVKGQFVTIDEKTGEEVTQPILQASDLKKNHYSCLIDEMGKWFTILYKTSTGQVIEFRDSLKLFLYSVSDLAKQMKGLKFSQVDYGQYWDINKSAQFDLKKGHIDHSKERPIGQDPTPEEAKYVCEDVAIVYGLLKSFIQVELEGDIKAIPLTIGSKTLEDFYIDEFADYNIGEPITKQIKVKTKEGNVFFKEVEYILKRKDVVKMGRNHFEEYYPDLTQIALSEKMRDNNLIANIELSHDWFQVKPYIEANPAVLTSICERDKIEDELVKQTLSRLAPLNAFDYINGAYHGGICTVNPLFQNKILTTHPKDFQGVSKEVIAIEGACVADVNSLYPSTAISESGNRYAIGAPTIHIGNIPDYAKGKDHVYFVRFECELKGMKENPLHDGEKFQPFIQIKGNVLYKGTKHLETTDYYNGSCYSDSVQWNGKEHSTKQVFFMYKTSFERMLKEYNVKDLKILDCLVFNTTEKSPFDSYYKKLAKIKQESKGVDPFRYMITKIYMNSLYGKFASSPKSNFKIVGEDANGKLKFQRIASTNKRAGYIAIGAAITDNAMNFTLDAINLFKPWFCYADTDSIHCACDSKRLYDLGLPIHPSALNHWDVEKSSLYAMLFLRQKTYIEYESPTKFDVRCAGMTQASKTALELTSPSYMEKTLYELQSLEKFQELQPNVQEYIIDKWDKKEPFTIDQFDVGLKLPGKLIPKQEKGGIDLVPVMFEIKGKDERPTMQKLSESRKERLDQKRIKRKEKCIAKRQRRKKEREQKEKDLRHQTQATSENK